MYACSAGRSGCCWVISGRVNAIGEPPLRDRSSVAGPRLAVTTETTPFLDAARGRATAVHPGLVHAAGGAFAARVPGDPGRRFDPRRHQAARSWPPTSRSNRCSRYGVDAAVLFSDIVVPAHAVGFGIDVAPGTGPVAERPLRTRADLERLRPLEVDDVDYVVDTVRLLAAELPDDVPLLAFAGAPFTVASYLIEGRPSRDYRHTKALIHTDEVLWHEIMERLADSAITFIDAQLSNGASAFQLFDSWAGSLSRRDYDRFVLPHSRRVFDELRRRHPRRAGDPFRDRLRPSARIDARRRAERARPRLAHPDHRCAARLGRRTSSCRATSTRRSCWPVPTPRSPVPSACSTTTHGPTADGTPPSHLQPRARGSARCRSGCAAGGGRLRPRAAPSDANVEHRRHDRPRSRWSSWRTGRRAIRARSRRTTPTSGAAARPRPRRSPTSRRATWPSAACRRSPRSPRPNATPCSVRSTSAHRGASSCRSA